MLLRVKQYCIVDPIKERVNVYRFKGFELDVYEENERRKGIKYLVSVYLFTGNTSE